MKSSGEEVVVFCQGLLVMVAAAFWVLIASGRMAMDPSVYGRAVYALPAELWAAVIMGAHLSIMLGIKYHVWGLAFFGSVAASMVYTAFPVLAVVAQFGDLVTLFSALAFLPAHIALCYICAANIWGRHVRKRRN